MTPSTVPEQGRVQVPRGEARGKPRAWRQRDVGELVSEALGTAIIILFGCGRWR